MFNYDEAFSRNIGWVTEEEQQQLKNCKVAIGGLGGVGGSHLIVLARLGISQFSISDLDEFDYPNFNRQYGATCSTVGKPKAEVMEQVIRDINPQATITNFKEGINDQNLLAFLDGVDIYVDSLDIFAVDIRRKVFAKCRELGIPAITAAPMGMGTAILVFLPDQGMSFEEYFGLEGLSLEDQVVKFVIGVSPSVQQRKYLVAKRSVNFLKKKVPSTIMGIELAAGVCGSHVLKILLQRGPVPVAPRGLHFDAYRNKLLHTWRPFGHKNPLQRFMFWYLKRLLASD
ncbi:ThiF family adenylyltransferase [Chromatiaceae bacterium AAb-1]|nr:ThiF family adenylyltransferase [Chromatiaceae bacterium AAb-1]